VTVDGTRKETLRKHKERRQLNILQVGCFAGNDSVSKFLRKYRDCLDKVVLVDASIDSLNLAKQHYKDFETIIFKHLAVVDSEKQIVDLFYPENEPVCAQASLDKEHVLLHKSIEAQRDSSAAPLIKSVAVNAIRINRLLSEFPNKLINRLYVDTEGHDAKIINDIDFSIYKIPYINFEFIHSDGPFKQGHNLRKALQTLNDNNYCITQDGEYNMIAINK